MNAHSSEDELESLHLHANSVAMHANVVLNFIRLVAKLRSLGTSTDPEYNKAVIEEVTSFEEELNCKFRKFIDSLANGQHLFPTLDSLSKKHQAILIRANNTEPPDTKAATGHSAPTWHRAIVLLWYEIELRLEEIAEFEGLLEEGVFEFKDEWQYRIPNLMPIAFDYESTQTGLTLEFERVRIFLDGSVAIDDPAPQPSELQFLRKGDTFHIVGFNEEGHVPSTKGLEQLEILLRYPNVELSMEGLHSLRVGHGASNESHQETLDPEAVQSYRTTIKELSESIRRAKADGNTQREIECQTDLTEITSQLESSMGLQNRQRALNSKANRLRPTISGNLKTAYKKIREAGMTNTASHFESSISSEGGSFKYHTTEEIHWKTNW